MWSRSSKSLLALSFAGLALSTPILPRYTNSTSSGIVCNGTFSRISAQTWVDGMNPGWNLGNTLDGIPDEGDWGNPPVVPSTFDDVKQAGFKGIRLPVTWAYHFTTEAPDYDVDPAWLQRVSDVVDMVTERDMYVLVNVHHDSWVWADVTKAGANYTQIEEKFYRLWYQIGTKLACKSSLLAYEPINEPPGTTAAHAAELKKLEDLFLKAITDAGGFNPDRVVTLNGPQENSDLTSQYFIRPTNITNPWAIQYHYYSPYPFIFSAWGSTIWGSEADKAALEADIANIRNNFTDVPLIVGEWAASPVATENAARWRYFDFFVRTAAKYNTTTVLWDNGADFLDRANHVWRDQTAIDIYMSAVAGQANALPDSTTDPSAATQFTSADLFVRVGQNVSSQTLPYILPFNISLISISGADGAALTKGSDYSVSGDDITFSASFLRTYFTSTTSPGSVANLTLDFSSGADLTLNLVLWDTPVLSSTSSSVAAANGSNISTPIQWKGINKPATVKAVTTNGTYLVDDFTSYYGPLQNARTTYNSQWNWDTDNVIITAAAVSAVQALGQDVIFTFEFYPRVPGNSVNYTLTV
ncbi:endoglucanase B [Aureobasidium pullulans]|uniref:Endoglucanase B n=1 Tax=Aureobasidium pullulans TaxID=5580 RepID=A0A4S9UNI0_AURPU|nr:endoglucanase B [Aureobasidium pullulans]